MVLHLDRYLSYGTKRQVNIFVEMSKFVGSRTKKQCKSHQDKFFRQESPTADSVQLALKSYYREEYRTRYLPLKHCLTEFKEMTRYLGAYWESNTNQFTPEQAIDQFRINWERVLTEAERRE